ncbi:hypothetical protein BDZ94DRAFT_1264820 [Collybia nuda]|uniref:Uncharacterized protein n=1 Tax=Collybia nuda TaxID=64659 RepID=A0A9P5Y290_9AGAR|nr:hypothetical protein BDZ94DRAFT_1264820 [Collybia nuda]
MAAADRCRPLQKSKWLCGEEDKSSAMKDRSLADKDRNRDLSVRNSPVIFVSHKWQCLFVVCSCCQSASLYALLLPQTLSLPNLYRNPAHEK